MGVTGLWTVVQPCARPTNLATLNRKRLAVDASIWIYQFLKAVRDKEGNALRNSHVVGFFRRICKLLWHGIQPVFVFDGSAPALKIATIQSRKRRREGRREDAARTAGKLLAVQMHRLAEEEEEKRKRRDAGIRDDEEEQEKLPDMDNIVYADELGMSQQERQKNRAFRKQDAYHLPELSGSLESMAKAEDPRIMSVDELEEYAKQFNDGEDISLYDFSKIDFDSDFFKSLPPADRYNILNAARIRSRLRMGLSQVHLSEVFPNKMDFSRFQIERVMERNNLTQRVMRELNMVSDLTLNVAGRVAGERNREYILVKNDDADGGWALGVVGGDKDIGKMHKPIDIDALQRKFQEKTSSEEDDDEWEDEEFEDVPIEGLNRLPKPKPTSQTSQDQGIVDDPEDSLFIDNDYVVEDYEEDEISEDEDEALARAIAMSLESQHGVRVPTAEEDEDATEKGPTPEWNQKAVEAPKPILNASGRMVAHIVNNRAHAAVPQPRENDSDSDSDMDLQSALAAARKAKAKAAPASRPVEKATVKPNVKNPLDGPLPFEKLNWNPLFGSSRKFSLGSKQEKPALLKEQQKPAETVTEKLTENLLETETGDLEVESIEDAGGFVRESSKERESGNENNGMQKANDKPRSLPPWMLDTGDIRESLEIQRQFDREMAAEDEEAAREELLRRQQKDTVVEIESSSNDDSDIEILDAPPSPKQKPVPFEEPGASLPLFDDYIAKSTSQIERPVSVNTELATNMATAPRSSSLEEDMDEEFEDVLMPPPQPVAQPVLARDDEAARIEAEIFGSATTLAQQNRREGLAALSSNLDAEDGIIDPNAPAPEEFDDPSDSEEEALLVQLAEEAEEHARFASELNNKSQRENHATYEQELRQLRNQQKKDRRDADEVTQIMVTECQALLRLFGIPYITAPMEAEAQCAELVRLNLVDGIVTDDSDTFLFGGTRVYKNMFNSNKLVECYLAKDLENELSLSREQLISLAQLLGSDYTEGIPGVGPVTAIEILSEFPGKDGLADFRDWWLDIQHHGRPKEADAANPFRRKFRKTHGAKLFLPLGFPSNAVFDAYIHPEVDSSPEPFQWGVPDLEGLRQFLMATIGWSQERTDEVLVPVIRDMNTRASEGTQTNITRYFEGSVGSSTAVAKDSFAPRQRVQGSSKRMVEAVGRLRAKKAGEKGLSVEMPVLVYEAPKKRKRGKGKEKGVDPEEAGDEAEEGGETEQDGDSEKEVRGSGRPKRTARGRSRGGRQKRAEEGDDNDSEGEASGSGLRGKRRAAGTGRARGGERTRA